MADNRTSGKKCENYVWNTHSVLIDSNNKCVYVPIKRAIHDWQIALAGLPSHSGSDLISFARSDPA